MIKFINRSEIAFTDGNFIYLHPKFKNDIKTAQGLIAHESGHKGYGSFELAFEKLIKTFSKKYSFPNTLVKRIVNIVEDIRINTINKKKFPGFYNNLKLFTLRILQNNKSKIHQFLDIFSYINLYMEDYEEFQVKPKFRTINISDYDWKAINMAKKLLLKTLTPSTSIIICDQLCKILKKYIVIKKYKSSIPLRTYNTSEYIIRAENKNNQEHSEIYECRDDTKNFEEIDCSEKFDCFEEIDCFEDPVFIENYEASNKFEINQLNKSLKSNQDFCINQYDDIMNNDTKRSNTELQKSSEKIIDKIANDNITSEDIEHLIKKLDEIERINDNLKENEKKSENNDFIDYFENKELLEKLNNETNSCSFYNGKKDETDDFNINFNSNKDIELKDKLHIENKNQSLEEIVEIITKANENMNQRLVLIENYTSIEFSKNKLEKKTIETRIENENMIPLQLSHNQIIKDYKNVISKAKLIFSQYNTSSNRDQFQKTGTLNKNLIKAITSDFKFNKCFTRKIKQKELNLLLLVDISGSMEGIKLESAKIAMVILCEALSNIAKIRIVLFTGANDARNILIKDFNEILNIKKIDRFGRHKEDGCNLDGISIKNEAAKLNKNEIIIVISDGEPSGDCYDLNDAVFDIQCVRKNFKVFAFSIDALGDYLNLLYGKNWILTKSADKIDLSDKIIKFCKFVVKEFFI